jgi:hypothetical protein
VPTPTSVPTLGTQTPLYRSNSTSFANVPTPTSVHHLVHMWAILFRWFCHTRHLPLWHCPRHQSMGAAPQALPFVDLSQFQPMVTMKRPWIHGPIVIGLEPLQSTYRPNLHTCCLHNRLWEPTKTLRLKGGEIKGREAPYLRRPAPYFGSTTSPTDTCKETHLGATWCIHLWWFHWRFDPRARRGCHTDH